MPQGFTSLFGALFGKARSTPEGDAVSRFGESAAAQKHAKRLADLEDVGVSTVNRLGQQPVYDQPGWIPAASSWVDAFYWQPGPGATQSNPKPDRGARLYVAFRQGDGTRVEGYYENISEALYDDLFDAPSKGEWVHDHLYKKIAYHQTGTGSCIGTSLPWPRRGSRGGDLTPGSWHSRTGKMEKARRGQWVFRPK